MGLKANGAKLEWHSYEYARLVKGEVVEAGDIDELRARKRALGLPGKIFFRGTYVTEWIEAAQ